MHTSFSLEKAIFMQQELRKGIILENGQQEDFGRVAGVDLAYWKQSEEEYAVCCIVVLDRATKQVIENQYAWGELKVPIFQDVWLFGSCPWY